MILKYFGFSIEVLTLQLTVEGDTQAEDYNRWVKLYEIIKCAINEETNLLIHIDDLF